jgi:hypothetical protein
MADANESTASVSPGASKDETDRRVTPKTKKPKTRKKSKARGAIGKQPQSTKAEKVRWMFPRATLEKALSIPNAIKNLHGGNPWEPEEIRKAIGVGTGGNAWFYLTAASRDYGLTIGNKWC